MIKTAVSAIVIIILISPLSYTQASTNNDIKIKTSVAFANLIYSDVFTSSLTKMIGMKNGGKYDESKDPALRKGTENWEQPQGSFWIVPAALVGLVFVVLFFTKQ